MINILTSNNECIINVDVIGSHNLNLITVSGLFNIIILDETDWIEINGEHLNIDTRLINITISDLIEILNEKHAGFEHDNSTGITTFPEEVTSCSDRFKHIFNIKSFPVSNSTSPPRTNGPMIMLIKCEGIPTGMRFCDQSVSSKYYAYELENIVSVNLNQFSVGYPFTLTGNQYKI